MKNYMKESSPPFLCVTFVITVAYLHSPGWWIALIAVGYLLGMWDGSIYERTQRGRNR